MRLREWLKRHASVVALSVLGVVLVVWNVMETMSRTFVPTSIAASVTDVEVRREKHAGLDDVYLIHFSDGTVRHAEGSVFASLHVGALVEKDAWSGMMTIDGEAVELEWSDDVRGMVVLMPWILVGVGVMGFLAVRLGG